MTAPARTEPAASGNAPTGHRSIIIILLVAAFVVILNETTMNVALASIMGDFGVTERAAQQRPALPRSQACGTRPSAAAFPQGRDVVENLLDRFTVCAGVGQLPGSDEEVFDHERDIGEWEHGFGHGRYPLSVVRASCCCAGSSAAANGTGATSSHSPIASGLCFGGTIRPCGSRTWTGSTYRSRSPPRRSMAASMSSARA